MNNQDEADTLAEARGRTDETLKELRTSVAKRRHNRVLNIEQSLRYERVVTNMALRHADHLQEMIGLKNVMIGSLRANGDRWKEIARRHGAKVDDEPSDPSQISGLLTSNRKWGKIAGE